MYMQRLVNTPVYTALSASQRDLCIWKGRERARFNPPFHNPRLQLEPSSGSPHTKRHLLTASSQIHHSRGYSRVKYPKGSDPTCRAAFLSRTEHSFNSTRSSPHSSRGKRVKPGTVQLPDTFSIPVITEPDTQRCWVPDSHTDFRVFTYKG